MLIQTSKTLVHLQNTNEDLFNEVSVPPLTAYATTTLKPQKGSKGIIKVIHDVTSSVLTKIL